MAAGGDGEVDHERRAVIVRGGNPVDRDRFPPLMDGRVERARNAGETEMNKAVPVAIGVLVVAILAVEGRLGALWTAIKGGSGAATSGKIPSGTGMSGAMNLSAPNSGDVPISLPIGNNSILSSVSGAGVAGNAVAQTIANRRYAVDHGTDPALNDIYAKYPISNDPVSQANWQQFIACYLRGTDIQECANRWIAKG